MGCIQRNGTDKKALPVQENQAHKRLELVEYALRKKVANIL